eukprot:TRINITY_DN14273_c0_g1_i1.p1 TRINITY_DN14273_c0_g1~~TRINITY_DN14273_c0_g1_i1.p1  ORF type:complete len:609 (+),score=74.69 TRINITY_DN14273_c0_g1_i1:40-1827(+)
MASVFHARFAWTQGFRRLLAGNHPCRSFLSSQQSHYQHDAAALRACAAGIALAATFAAASTRQQDQREGSGRNRWLLLPRTKALCSTPSACHTSPASAKREHDVRKGEPDKLLSWLTSHRGKHHSGLEVFESSIPGAGLGLRLSTTSQGCSANEVLLRIPSNLVLDAEESGAREHTLVAGEELPVASRRLRTRLANLRLACSQNAQETELSPWIRCVDPPKSMPLLLVAYKSINAKKTSVDEALSGTVILHHASALHGALQKEAGVSEAQGQTVAEEPNDSQPAQRELTGPARKAARKLEEERRKAAAALEDAQVWAQAVLMSRAYKLPKASSHVERLVLAPIIDIANSAAERSSANAQLRAEKDGAVSLVSTRPIKSGEEILTCYGEFDNEQLLFTYGYIEPSRFLQGPVCPVQLPEGRVYARLWHFGSQRLRSGSAGAVQGPARLLCAPDRTATELLAALRLSDVSEEEAKATLRQFLDACKANDEAKADAVLDELLAPGINERVAAVQLLTAWRQALRQALSQRPALPAELSDTLAPALRLQDWTLEAVEKARDEVLSSLPLSFRINWVIRDSVTVVSHGVYGLIMGQSRLY